MNHNKLMAILLVLIATVFLVLGCSDDGSGNVDDTGTDSSTKGETDTTTGTDSGTDGYTGSTDSSTKGETDTGTDTGTQSDTDTGSTDSGALIVEVPEIGAIDDILMGVGRSRSISLSATVKNDETVTYCVSDDSPVFATITDSTLSIAPVFADAGTASVTIMAVTEGDCTSPVKYDDTTFAVDVRLPQMVKDIVADTNLGSSVRYLTTFGDALLFSAAGNTGGRELWRTDGTPDGTSMVKDIYSGSGSSSPKPLCQMGDKLVFSAVDGTDSNNQGLWMTDGTEAGTVKMFNAEALGVKIDFQVPPVCADTKIYFRGRGAEDGAELWVTDGTQAGTHVTKIVTTGPQGGSPWTMVPVGDEVYFIYWMFQDPSRLWKSDGTELGTVELSNASDDSAPIVADQDGLVFMNGVLYFMANDEVPGGNSLYGEELWKYDFTANEFSLVKDVYTGTSSGTKEILAASDTQLFFLGNDGSGTGVELWVSDGTELNTRLVKDIRPGSESVTVENVAMVGERIFMELNNGDGYELWVSDGTEANTKMVKQLFVGNTDNNNLDRFTAYGEKLVFLKRNIDDQKTEVWMSDGTDAGTTRLVQDNSDMFYNYPSTYAVLGDNIYFNGTDFNNGEELWVSDGTPAGTQEVVNIRTTTKSSDPKHMVALGNKVLFVATDADEDREIWHSDGTAEGTTILKNLNAADSSDPRWLVTYDEKVFFFAYDQTLGAALWESDGLPDGTKVVKAFCSAEQGSIPNQKMTEFQDKLYFVADNCSDGQELWVSDGTANGTKMLVDLLIGEDGSSPYNFNAMGGALYFIAYNINDDAQLWKTDGTAAGTVNVSGAAVFDWVSTMIPMGDVLYFMAGGAEGTELWKSGGTEDTTVRVKDIYVGSNSGVAQLVEKDEKLYLMATDGNGYEIWTSDGTEDGTVKVTDSLWNMDSYMYQQMYADANGVFFPVSGEEGVYGLWTTDGTADGTKRLGDESSVLYPVDSAYYSLNEVTYFRCGNTYGEGLGICQTNGTAVGTFGVSAPQMKDVDISFTAKTETALFFKAQDAEHSTELWILYL